MGLLNQVFQQVDSMAEYLDDQADFLAPSKEPQFPLADSRLKDEVLATVETILRQLGWPLVPDKTPYPGIPQFDDVQFHRLETKKGTVALVQIPNDVMGGSSDWNDVDRLIEIMLKRGVTSFFARRD